jgi:hypothetical protein
LFDSIIHQHYGCVLLLLTAHNQKGNYTTKFFDYLASRRPIIAIPDDNGVINNTLFKYKTGFCADDVPCIKEIINNWYREWLNTKNILIEPHDEINKLYSRKYQCDLFVDIVENL